jgi:hypothetical protein
MMVRVVVEFLGGDLAVRGQDRDKSGENTGN